jgi:hypothetical protein
MAMLTGRGAFVPLAGVALGLFALAGCGRAGEPTSAPAPTAAPSTPPIGSTLAPTPEPPPEHRIGVRIVDGVGEFYDRLTGDKVVPRGNNYIRLANQRSPSGQTFFYHSTFNVGLYDSARAEQALRRMHADGYNVVRVFMNGNCVPGCIGDPAGGLSEAYIANVVDFLRLAKANGVFVILTTDAEPATRHYIDLLDTTWSAAFGGANTNYLRGGGILVGQAFWQDLIEALRAQDAPFEAIFAYALRNELFFETNAGPLSLTAGTVSTADGMTYDMASAEDRQRMMDENLLLWIDQVRGAIVELDPTALVTVGFFPPDQPNPWPSAPRHIRTEVAIWESTLDFIDLHPYPGGYGLDKLVENFGMAGMQAKPIIMGEFGASRSTYASAAATAGALQDWQVASCEFGFDGWLAWTWDSDEQADFYNALSDQGQINQALAPVNRPDPCRPGEFAFLETNLALGKPVRASRALPGNPPENAVNGSGNDWWGAGDFATQWIEIDLGQPSSVRLIRLLTSQSPPGDTRHQVWVGSVPDQLYLLHTFEGRTADLQALEFIPELLVSDVRYVRVVTRLSPSWIGWREIEVIAP